MNMTGKMYQHGVLVAAASLVLVLLQLTTTGAIHGFGQVKNSWPEYSGMNALEAQKIMQSDPLLGSGNKVYIQEMATEDVNHTGVGTSQDVWLYTDPNFNIYQIPVRGTWHRNRVSPGWTELEGKPYKEAIEVILQEVAGLFVYYGPSGFIHVENVRSDRVFMNVDENGLVAKLPPGGAPRIG